MKITDTDRIDFIEREVLSEEGTVCTFELIDMPEPQDKGPIEMFTCLTQHITGKSIRKLIDAAIVEEREGGSK